MSVSQDMTIPIFLASAPIVSKITPGTLLVKLVTVSKQNLSFLFAYVLALVVVVVLFLTHV